MSESRRPTWPPSWLPAARSRCRPGADSVQARRGKPPMSGRRRFGALRKLPSGRYQASWTGPDGRRRSAATTFATKTKAARWLGAIETDVLRGTWVDDRLAEVLFGDYAQRWLRRCAGPAGGRRSRSRTGFLRAVLNTAVADGGIARNPCQIRGAGSDRAPERPVATRADRGSGRCDQSAVPRSSPARRVGRAAPR